MKRLYFILTILFVIYLLNGCTVIQSQNCTVSGVIYFGGEPGTSLPDPGVSSLGNNYAAFTLKSSEVLPKPTTSLIVSCDPKVSPEDQQKILHNLGFTIKHQLFSDSNSYVIFSDSLRIDQAYDKAKNSPLIKTVEYNNSIVKQSVTPNDAYYNRQWDLRVTKFNVAWENFKGRDQVTVAVLDTGLNTASVEFANRLAPPTDWYDFVEDDYDPSDNVYYNPDNQYSHGTNVAGIIGAVPDNNYGYAGAAWSPAIKILPVRVLDQSGSGTLDGIIDGIYWAVLHDAKVINLSLGMSGNNNSTLFNNVIEYANSKGVTIVCAAGNENTAINYPARLSAIYPNVIAVGATGYNNQKAWYSCFGSELTVMAPGGDNKISGTDEQKYIWNITYNKESPAAEELNCGFIGTSQATPHITALAALLYSYGVTSPARVRSIISQTATDLGAQGRDNQYGNGLMNAFAALTAATSDITKISIGIHYPQTTHDLLSPLVTPDYRGAFYLPNIPKGNWELYAEYTNLTNGYKYYCSVPITVTRSITKNLSLQLIPNN